MLSLLPDWNPTSGVEPVADISLSAMVALVKGFFARMWRMPTVVRLGCLFAAASEDVGARRFLEAKAKLLQIQEHSPPELGNPGLATLLLALVYLEIGDFKSAADAAAKGLSQVQRLGFLRPEEKAYLSCAANLIYEAATSAVGEPKRLHSSSDLAALDLRRVRSAVTDALPLAQLARGGPIH